MKEIEAAHKMIDDLCQGKKEWIMHIPADRENDPDLVITAGLLAAEKRIKELEARLDPDVWKTPLKLDALGYRGQDVGSIKLCPGDEDSQKVGCLFHREYLDKGWKEFSISSESAARAAAWLASYAAAHGCAVALPLDRADVTDIKYVEPASDDFRPISGFEVLFEEAKAEACEPTEAEIEELAQVLRNAHAKFFNEKDPNCYSLSCFLSQARAAWRHMKGGA